MKVGISEKKQGFSVFHLETHPSKQYKQYMFEITVLSSHCKGNCFT